ncbi:hypothetical protein WKK05_36480 (plasmid) [Nostoc sp. UHCC 0302]
MLQVPHHNYTTVLVGYEAQWLPRLRAILPDKLFDFGVRKRLNLP